ncbi:hypothetical protein ATG98_0524 [Marinobacter sp. LV10R520-4]|uniref:hypothetical protein n=1 Tax=Marinobacter sp. LV10R520-4 TaxID=1761796 RepID=UPI000C00F67C|nr:hypothetical protein [Marinobacter sp. LV10R520-4]PFG51572.1 hypothetical protein ATG98_0524 [Marinobacter sp. LV10R520-4]
MTNTEENNPRGEKPITEQVRQAAGAASEEVKAGAQEAADTVSAEADHYADEAKGAAADEVKDVASALRTAAKEMRSGSAQERTFSQIAEALADASDTMRDKDLGEMVGAVTNFARRNPMVFLGSAAFIGFAATRFARASSDGRSDSNGADQYRTQPDRYSTGDRFGTSSSASGQGPAGTPSRGGNTI